MAALGALCVAPEPACAKDELKELLRELKGEDDPTQRRALVRGIARTPSPRAAGKLAEIARTDPSAAVRVAAVRTLGRMPADNALDLLVELADGGGVRSVRGEVAKAAARRQGGRTAFVERMTARDAGPATRGLFVQALGSFPDLEAAAALERLARGSDTRFRVEALRALAGHKHGRTMLSDLLVDVLREHQDMESVLCGLDLARELADAEFAPVARLLTTFLEPEVQRAVKHAEARLAYIDALERSRKARREGYADPVVPEPPPSRPRYDIVYVCDTTGSVVSHLDGIARKVGQEILLLNRLGSDVRVGIVAYRDTTPRRGLWATRVHPLGYDLGAAIDFLRSQRSGGADSQGATIYRGLREALDRMSWRWSANRQTTLIADSKAGEPARCLALSRLHFRTDKTALRVWYLARTRRTLPKEITELARISGGTVEILE